MKTLLRNESGQALIEFALFASAFILILAGVTDYAIYVHHQMELTEAATAGAAFGTLPGHQEDIVGMQNVAKATAADVSGLSATATNVYACTPGGVTTGATVASTATCAGYGTPIMYVRVQTSATVPAVIRWAGLTNSLSLGATATYRVPWTR